MSKPVGFYKKEGKTRPITPRVNRRGYTATSKVASRHHSKYIRAPGETFSAPGQVLPSRQMWLLSQMCKRTGVDTKEIDPSLDYFENKTEIERLSGAGLRLKPGLESAVKEPKRDLQLEREEKAAYEEYLRTAPKEKTAEPTPEAELGGEGWTRGKFLETDGWRADMEKHRFEKQGFEVKEKYHSMGRIELLIRKKAGDKSEPVKEVPAKAPVATSASSTYNKSTGKIIVNFGEKPDREVLNEIKAQGFRYHPSDKTWVASWSPDRREIARKYSGGKLEEINVAVDQVKKAERIQAAAERHQEKANEYFDREHKILDMIPMGQPILKGHHSEGRHRSDLKKADSLMRKALEESETAEKLRDRAAGAAQRDSPKTIYNRVKRLEAEERSLMRREDSTAKEWLPHIRERLKVERTNYKESGGIPAQSMTLKKGDRIKTSHGPAIVTKVNRDTLRVDFDQPSLSGFHKISKSQVLG